MFAGRNIRRTRYTVTGAPLQPSQGNDMTDHELVMYQLKGIISEAPADQQRQVYSIAARIRAIAAESAEARVAIALVSSEVMAGR